MATDVIDPTVLAVEADPFADLVDDVDPATPDEVRTHYLGRAKRGYAELHRDWVQRPSGSKSPRGSALATLVTERRENALEAFLLLHSLQPVLGLGQPLDMDKWAKLMTRTTPVSDTSASKAFRALADMNLVSRDRLGKHTTITPLSEDGSGDAWERPGIREKPGQGYFTLPFAYWLEGYSTLLHLPGKAMLLVLLSATTQRKPAVQIPIDRTEEWYGISRRTAQRGYHELSAAGVMREHTQRIKNPEVKGGFHHVYHRALVGPFGTSRRHELQQAARAASAGRRGSADTSIGGTP